MGLFSVERLDASGVGKHLRVCYENDQVASAFLAKRGSYQPMYKKYKALNSSRPCASTPQRTNVYILALQLLRNSYVWQSRNILPQRFRGKHPTRDAIDRPRSGIRVRPSPLRLVSTTIKFNGDDENVT